MKLLTTQELDAVLSRTSPHSMDVNVASILAKLGVTSNTEIKMTPAELMVIACTINEAAGNLHTLSTKEKLDDGDLVYLAEALGTLICFAHATAVKHAIPINQVIEAQIGCLLTDSQDLVIPAVRTVMFGVAAGS